MAFLLPAQGKVQEWWQWLGALSFLPFLGSCQEIPTPEGEHEAEEQKQPTVWDCPLLGVYVCKRVGVWDIDRARLCKFEWVHTLYTRRQRR